MRFSFLGTQPSARSSGRLQPYQSLFVSDHADGTTVINHLAVDMHAHWLPGVDDGAKDFQESIEIIRKLSDLGYRKLIATPHIMSGYYDNDPSYLIEKFEEFLRKFLLENIDIELALAAEYMIDEGFKKHLDNDFFLLLPRKMILIELPILNAYAGYEELIFEIKLKGYQPVVAHPERYGYMHADLEKYEQLKEAGCLFQLNMLSLNGHYGKNVSGIARELLDRKWYDLVGTDLHNRSQLKQLNTIEVNGHFLNHTLIKNVATPIPTGI